MALSGVRSSCDIVARNSLFRRLASWMRTFSASSAAARAFISSPRLRWLTSRAVATTSGPSGEATGGLSATSRSISVPSRRSPRREVASAKKPERNVG